MPTITAMAWDRLLVPNTSTDSTKKPSPPPPDQQQHQASPPPPPPPPYYISPALYAATDTSSILDPSPYSPYVVNCKRRGLPSAAADRSDDPPPDGAGEGEVGAAAGCAADEGLGSERCGEGWEDEGAGDNQDDDGDFFDPRDTMSLASSSEGEDGGSFRRYPSQGRRSLASQSDYYDAASDFFEGSSSHSSPSINTNNEIDLRGLRINLLEEIDKRKRAEESLLHMQDQWQRMAKSLCQVGFSLPEIQHSGNVHQTDPVALCQEIVVTKFVMEAVERGIARAETEAIIQEVIESKNHEISRLRDRLQYYEAMNREMSQRNQEVVEAARQQRIQRKRRRRWIWIGCISLSVTVGAGLLAYAHLSPSTKTSCADAASTTTDAGDGSKSFPATE